MKWLYAALAAGALCLPLACSAPGPHDDGPWMEPGVDCMSCHTHASQGGKPWTVAGTVFPWTEGGDATTGQAGATITFTDANSNVIALESNGSGNFYTREAIVFPLKKLVVSTPGQGSGEMAETFLKTMTKENFGRCNLCHTAGGQAGTQIQGWLRSP